jgi:hypothetical protein
VLLAIPSHEWPSSKEKKYRSEFTNGFANGSFITMTDYEWISEDAFMTLLCHFQAHRVTSPCPTISGLGFQCVHI